MSAVETPAADLVAARIELSAGVIDACCGQIDKGDIPVAELTARIRAESEALRTAVGRDNRNATGEKLLSIAGERAGK